MTALIITLHVIICILLIGIILIQAGRGGGLVENFSGVESMFGPKTNAFLTRVTTVLSISFFVTCLGLAILSVRQSKSLLQGLKPEAAAANINATSQTEPLPVAQPAANETANATAPQGKP
jgi:preprotein translocase subunit SecG